MLEGEGRPGPDWFCAGGFAPRHRGGGGNRKGKLNPTMPGLRLYPAGFQKNGPALVQQLLPNFYRNVDRIIESHAQRDGARRQGAPARASRGRIERQDAQFERKPAKSSGGRKLRDGRVFTGSNQTA